MVRLTKTLFVHSLGAWLSLAGIDQLSAQQPLDLANETIRISEFGLEDQVPSAIDLVGPEGSSAGRNRAALAHRFRCWIDGAESRSIPDLNDPRVRAIRRFLGQEPAGKHGVITIQFPDQTRIAVHVARVPDLDPDDWTQSAYDLEVRPGSVRAQPRQVGRN